MRADASVDRDVTMKPFPQLVASSAQLERKEKSPIRLDQSIGHTEHPSCQSARGDVIKETQK